MKSTVKLLPIALLNISISPMKPNLISPEEYPSQGISNLALIEKLDFMGHKAWNNTGNRKIFNQFLER